MSFLFGFVACCEFQEEYGDCMANAKYYFCFWIPFVIRFGDDIFLKFNVKTKATIFTSSL